MLFWMATRKRTWASRYWANSCGENQAPIALEAIEGTDECIRRAGHLCRSGGMTVVKVAKASAG